MLGVMLLPFCGEVFFDRHGFAVSSALLFMVLYLAPGVECFIRAYLDGGDSDLEVGQGAKYYKLDPLETWLDPSDTSEHTLTASALNSESSTSPSSPLYKPHSGRDLAGYGNNWRGATAQPNWWKVEIDPGKLLATRIRLFAGKQPWYTLEDRKNRIQNNYLLVDDVEIGSLKPTESDRVLGTNLNMLWTSGSAPQVDIPLWRRASRFELRTKVSSNSTLGGFEIYYIPEITVVYQRLNFNPVRGDPTRFFNGYHVPGDSGVERSDILTGPITEFRFDVEANDQGFKIDGMQTTANMPILGILLIRSPDGACTFQQSNEVVVAQLRSFVPHQRRLITFKFTASSPKGAELVTSAQQIDLRTAGFQDPGKEWPRQQKPAARREEAPLSQVAKHNLERTTLRCMEPHADQEEEQEINNQNEAPWLVKEMQKIQGIDPTIPEEEAADWKLPLDKVLGSTRPTGRHWASRVVGRPATKQFMVAVDSPRRVLLEGTGKRGRQVEQKTENIQLRYETVHSEPHDHDGDQKQIKRRRITEGNGMQVNYDADGDAIMHEVDDESSGPVEDEEDDLLADC
ncbi:unnamed protein product [Amoebophrya sp. A120]|nr:unnamed protein product [Amoebophrya sp. A120]|eukprot:GSA120T00011038001.1